MKNEVNGRILATYFEFENILAKFGADKFKSFSELANIYGEVNKSTIDELFQKTQASLISGIDSANSGFRIEKQLKTCLKMGIDSGISEIDKWVLINKCDSLRRMEKANLSFNYEIDEDGLLNIIENEARSGELMAIPVLGFLLANGIGVQKNYELATKYLTIGEQWGSLACILMLTQYDKENIDTHLSFFKAICDKSIHPALYKSLLQKFPTLNEIAEKKEAHLIKSYLFYNKNSKMTKYEPQVARVAYCDKLLYCDKEKILFSTNMEKIAIANELPLDNTVKNVVLSYKVFEDLPLKREGEADKIFRKLAAYDDGGQKMFKPILLICKDKFVTDMYKQALASVLQCNCVKSVDVRGINLGNLENGRNNSMLRSIADEGLKKVMLCYDNVQDISFEMLDKFSRLISVKNRASFQLNDIGINFNFSDTIIILTATNTPHNSILNVCTEVYCQEVTDAEKPVVVEKLLGKRQARSKQVIKLDKEKLNTLCGMSVDKIVEIIREIFTISHSRSLKGASAELTDDDFLRCIDDSKSRYSENYGFNRTNKAQ